MSRCVCHDQSFERLKTLAVAEGLSFDELVARTGCCTGCTMCEPYVRLMLRTGGTDLPVMSDQQFRAAGIDPTPSRPAHRAGGASS